MNTRERGADPLAGWLRGRDPRGAWEHMRHTLDTNGPARALILTLAGTLEGRLALERSRRIWACHGLPAPFDDLLRAVFGAGDRRRTRSGIFRAVGRETADGAGPESPRAVRAPSSAARAGRGPGG